MQLINTLGNQPKAKFDDLVKAISDMDSVPSVGIDTSQRSIDRIKYYLYQNKSAEMLSTILDKDVTLDFNKYQVYNEVSDFYNDEFKSGLLQKINDELSGEVFDVYSKIRQGKTELSYLKQYGKDTNLDLETLKDIDSKIRLYGKVCILFNPDSTVSVLEPFRYSIINDSLRYVELEEYDMYDRTTYDYKERVLIDGSMQESYFINASKKNPQGSNEWSNFYEQANTLMYEEIEYNKHFSDALFEMVMFHSEIYSALQKEIYTTTPELFLDEGYLENGALNNKRLAYTPVKNMESIPGSDKPLFELYNPDIRTDEYKTTLELIEGKIANLAGVSIGVITGNATEGVINNDSSARLINLCKREAEFKFNKLIEDYFDPKQRLELPAYRLQSQDSVIKNAVLLVNNGIGSNLTNLRDLYPTLSEKELMKMYLTIEIKNSRPLTKEEEELAIKMGLKDEEPAFDPNQMQQVDANGKPIQQVDANGKPVEQKTDSSGKAINNNITTDQTVDKQTQVNTQGVAANKVN